MAPLHLAKTFNVKDFFFRGGVSQPNANPRRANVRCEQGVSTYDVAPTLSALTPSTPGKHSATVSPPSATQPTTDIVRWASSSLVSTLRGLKFSTNTLQSLASAWPSATGIAASSGGEIADTFTGATAVTEAPTITVKPDATPAIDFQATAEKLAQYVQPVSKLAIKRARVYADLADLAYDVTRLSIAFLFTRHRLLLVKTSKQQSVGAPAPPNAERASSVVPANNIVPFGGKGGSGQVSARESVGGDQVRPTLIKQPASEVAAVKPRDAPLEWFACDNPENGTRIFAIQGSVSLQHWAINLSFDPVTFGDESLGVKVHRGVYQTALALYDQLLPLVMDHIRTSPKARVTFTGHSLGGSVASVLMLLYILNGVLQPNQVSPVYTFGSPAIFCEAPVINAASGAISPAAAGLTPKQGLTQRISAADLNPGDLTPTQLLQSATTPCSLTTHSTNSCRSLLRVIGVPEDTICNVMMHHDIVPRAFVCDYSSVSELLRSWGPAFKHHAGLSPMNRHKVLYDFVGTVCVLQPDRRQEFVSGDEYHNMLPPFPHLYTFTLPDGVLEDACVSLRQAVLAFMNNPHPLTVLKDYQSYGERGVISRYHNPQHYAKALFGLLRKL